MPRRSGTFWRIALRVEPSSTAVVERLRIRELMESSGVKFGTSGARGLVTQLSDRVAYAYAAAFLQHLERSSAIGKKTRVAVAGDRRSSTPRIKGGVLRAVLDRGHEPLDLGSIPSPALALFGLDEKIPSIMVTGSHIPEDRNGIKFNTAYGEILKEDEVSIAAQELDLPASFGSDGRLKPELVPTVPLDARARDNYKARFLRAFPEGALEGLKLGVYGHSAVGRELLGEILEGLGARVASLGYSDEFVSVDTEAIRPEDIELASAWARELGTDSIVSTDGDSDRPLVSDERGRFLRGDIAGILCAKYLGATTVVTPVSSNSAVERSGAFSRVIRTKIGSPYVLAAMLAARAEGDACVVGYEANGGFLTATPTSLARGALSPLPTRDAMLVILCILARARADGVPVSQLLADLPARYTASDRLPDFPTELSRDKLADIVELGISAAHALFGDKLGPVRSIDATDGVRIEFASTEIVHLRASGNAPELRCYAEAATEARAHELTQLALTTMQRWK